MQLPASRRILGKLRSRWPVAPRGPLLIATGRRPRIVALDLEPADIEVDPGAIRSCAQPNLAFMRLAM